MASPVAADWSRADFRRPVVPGALALSRRRWFIRSSLRLSGWPPWLQSSMRRASRGRHAKRPSGASSAARTCRIGRQRPTKIRCLPAPRTPPPARSGRRTASAWRVPLPACASARQVRGPTASTRGRCVRWRCCFSFRRHCWSREASAIAWHRRSASASLVRARQSVSMPGSRHRPTRHCLRFCWRTVSAGADKSRRAKELFRDSGPQPSDAQRRRFRQQRRVARSAERWRLGAGHRCA